jgi:hypothetical protein
MISIGWWMLPLTVTIAVVIWTVWDGRRATRENRGSLFNMDPMIWLVFMLRGLTVILAAWLIWAVLT